MSSVRITYPTPKLAQLLRTSGPISKAKPKSDETAELAGVCERQLIELAIDVEQAAGRLGPQPDEQTLATFYGLVAGGVGAGAVLERKGVDAVLLSLCSLVSRFRAHGVYDEAAVARHVQALRIFVADRQLSDADVDSRLAQLKASG